MPALLRNVAALYLSVSLDLSVLIRYHFDYESAQIWQSEVLEMSKHDPSVRRP